MEGCPNCASLDFCVDEQRGDIVCIECGCCWDSVRIADGPYHRSLREPVICGAYYDDVASAMASERQRCKRKSTSAPYRRSTYASERIGQWMGIEPAIDDYDWNEIKREWGVRTRNPRFVIIWPESPPPIFPDLLAAYLETERRAALEPDEMVREHDMYAVFPHLCHVMTRDDCRDLLRTLDERARRNNVQPPPRFVQKYYEKFLTIRYLLCGVPSTGMSARVTPAFVTTMKQLFMQTQVPFAQVVRGRLRRYSFISYNFCFRRIFDIMGCSYMGEDFPPLKSKRKRDDVVFLWLLLIRHLRWPYINSDAAIFGAEYGTEYSVLRERSSANAELRRARL
jgi:hypothetical protein